VPIFGRSRTLFKIFGFPIKMNPTWFLLFFLIVFSLGSENGLFYQWLENSDSIINQWLQPEGVETLTRWLLALVGALGLFVSLIAHELCHSLVARRTGMPVGGITLFIFGGVSEMEEEPPTAEAEFFMAVVGPVSSVVISALCLGVVLMGHNVLGFPDTVNVVFLYLAVVNLLLAGFNSLPAFPLDGGRVVRSALWGLTGNLHRATSIAARIGSAFGLMMIIGGVFIIFHGGLIGGIWLIFIGFFLRQAASSSYQQIVMREALGGETVRHFMSTRPVCVDPDLSLERFVHDYVLPYHYALFPVVDEDDQLIGTVGALDPRDVEQEQWSEVTVANVMNEEVDDLTIRPDEQAVEALGRLRGEQGKRLVAVEDGKPVGIVSLRDLLEFIELKVGLHPQQMGSRI
jgi:Zn-dependent protease/predicted transcriptional regulator